MRLVSALYNSFYPFGDMEIFKDFEIADRADFDFQAGDVLVVWGGADIHPSLYNKGRSQRSGADIMPSRRDTIEWGLMKKAKELKVPIIGICRGAQMLTALEGGKLYQHTDNHSGSHEVMTADGQSFVTNSIHHQMMVPDGTKHELIAWTKPIATVYHDVDELGNEIIYERGHKDKDPEFIYYPDVNGFAIQWHPEMMSARTAASNYVLNFIEKRLQ